MKLSTDDLYLLRCSVEFSLREGCYQGSPDEIRDVREISERLKQEIEDRRKSKS